MSAEEKLRELIHCIASYYLNKKNVARIFYMEKAAMRRIFNLEEQALSPASHPKIPREFKVKMEKISEIINKVIKEGVESGEFRKVNAQDAAFIFGALLRGFHFRGPLGEKNYNVKETTDLLHDFFLYGIKKARKE